MSSLQPPHCWGTSQALRWPLLSLPQPLSQSLFSISHFRLCLSIVSAEVGLRADRGLGRVAWVDGAQTEGPSPAKPVIASLSWPPQFFVWTQNSSPAPPLAPSLGQGWECPNLGVGRVFARSPCRGGVGGSEAESPLAPVPGGSVGRVGCWPGQDTQPGLFSAPHTSWPPKGVLAPMINPCRKVGASSQMRQSSHS